MAAEIGQNGLPEGLLPVLVPNPAPDPKLVWSIRVKNTGFSLIGGTGIFLAMLLTGSLSAPLGGASTMLVTVMVMTFIYVICSIDIRPTAIHIYPANKAARQLADTIDRLILILASNDDRIAVRDQLEEILPSFVQSVEDVLGIRYTSIRCASAYVNMYFDQCGDHCGRFGSVMGVLTKARECLRSDRKFSHDHVKVVLYYMAANTRDVFDDLGVDISTIRPPSERFGALPEDLQVKAIARLPAPVPGKIFFADLGPSLGEQDAGTVAWIRDAVAHLRGIDPELLSPDDALAFDSLCHRDLPDLEAAWRDCLATAGSDGPHGALLRNALNTAAEHLAGILKRSSGNAHDALDIMQRFMAARYGGNGENLGLSVVTESREAALSADALQDQISGR